MKKTLHGPQHTMVHYDLAPMTAPILQTKRVESAKLRRRLWILITVAGIGLVLSLLLLRNLGDWLQVNEPLQRTRAIVVFGGGLPFRAIEAGRLYQGGWGREVWITKGSENEADRLMQRLGIPTIAEHEYSRSVLLKLGVPEAAIRVVPDPVENTVSEVRAILRFAAQSQASGFSGPLLLVTSKAHSRRVRVIWNVVDHGNYTAIVRYAASDPFDPRHWWATTTDTTSTFREVFAILNAWLRFPIAPRER
jgi:uncharacterized SAM-binding protein YcdF (DUF218 family)